MLTMVFHSTSCVSHVRHLPRSSSTFFWYSFAMLKVATEAWMYVVERNVRL